MAIPVDPSRNPLPPVAQVLAEAALQRQNMLLGTGQRAPVPPAAEGTLPAMPAVPPGAVPPPLPTGAPVPAATERVSISPQARQSLEGSGGATGDARTGRAAQAPTAAGAQALAAPPAAPGVRALAAAVPPALAWPATGVSAPVRNLVAALVQQLTAPLQQPQRVAGIQPWTADLVRQVQGEGGGMPEGLGPALPPLQTWRVAQGMVQTAEGPRSFALTLRVPVPWLASQPLAPATALPATPLQAPFTGNPQALQSGVFALVLEGPDTAAQRTSALLVLDMAPQHGSAVYGREQMLARMDPWTQMAVLQASGHLPVDEDRERDRPLCEVTGCPYAGRSSCAQPFCLALRWVDPVVPTLPAGPGA